jgi:hypothetical protein
VGSTGPGTISRCAVAARETIKSCFTILNPAANAWEFNGNMTVNAPTCGIADNGSIDGKGNSNIVNTDYVCTQSGSGDSEINSNVPVDKCGSITNPYAGLTVTEPTSPALTVPSNDSASYSGGGTLSGNNTVKNGKTLTLDSGVYVIDGGSLDIKGTLNASNATIILKNGATFSVSAGGSMHLSARATGDTAGFAIIQKDGGSGSVSLGGNGTIEMSGMIYLEDYSLSFQGGPTYIMTGTSFVVNRLSMGGGGSGSLTITPAVNAPEMFTFVHLVQ